MNKITIPHKFFFYRLVALSCFITLFISQYQSFAQEAEEMSFLTFKGTTPNLEDSQLSSQGIAFNGNGKKMFIVSNEDNKIDFETTLSYDITVKISDEELSNIAAVTITVDDADEVSPTISITTLAKTVMTPEFAISGTVEAGSTVELFRGETSLGAATIENGTDWTANITLIEGDNSIITRATDTEGNITTDSVIITFDTTVPVISIIGLAVNDIRSPPTTARTGETVSAYIFAMGVRGLTATSDLTINNKVATFQDFGGGGYRVTYTVEKGDNAIYSGAVPANIQLQDAEGNLSNLITSLSGQGVLMISPPPKS